MADNKYKYPPAPPNGEGSFSNNIVGLQIVDGGGLTQGNFEFTNSVVEKSNRQFDLGVFSSPITLEDINITSVEQAKILVSKNFDVYPNYDLTEVTTFSLYGSLQKRLSSSITHIINYFPAAINIDNIFYNGKSGYTAYDIVYDSVEGTTEFKIAAHRIKNPFDIDFSENADRNISVRPINVSSLRNLTSNYSKYSLFVDGSSDEYKVLDMDPSYSVSAGTVQFIVSGKPFNNVTETIESLTIRPNNTEVDRVFNDDLDDIENFLLNRNVVPKYTTKFKVLKETQNGNFYSTEQTITWPIEGSWNLDIRTDNFDIYLEELSIIGEDMDEFKTNLISRFLTAGALKDFDTPEQKVESVLQIYGRSFDETKKFIDALANITSVHYIVENDIPSALLKNLAQTLGWDTNISPITNDDFIGSIFNSGDSSVFPGKSKNETPTELNYQYYRNLILNSAYLFKSKGTRKSIEALLRLIGAPKALIEFNEIIYLADGPLNINTFDSELNSITGGTKVEVLPVLNPNNTYTFQGQTFTGFTTETVIKSVNVNRSDYPVDKDGYPIFSNASDDFFYEQGAGWYEQTPQHRGLEIVNVSGSIFTGTNTNVQTELESFTYGEKYLNRYRNLPELSMGFEIIRTYDNVKSWTTDDTGLRNNSKGGYNAYYKLSDERLLINAKNIDLSLNMGQGILYDIWDMSRKYNYPIPSSGITITSTTGVDETIIKPRPKEKTFFEFAQTFYRNMINVKNRQTITDGKGGGYPTLQSLYWKYMNSEENVGIPSNKYTYQKMIDFTNGIGDYWMKLIEQMIPASTIWTGGQKMQNNVLQRQKVVWRRQRGCEIVPVACIPCSYTGQLFGYDCNVQTLTCNIELDEPQNLLTQAINSSVSAQGFQYSDCLLSTLVTEWFVEIRLDSQLLVLTQFYNGSGPNQYPTNNQWITAVNNSLEYLYQQGIDYSLNNNSLTVTNIGCNNDFTNKTLHVNVGINVNINCS